MREKEAIRMMEEIKETLYQTGGVLLFVIKYLSLPVVILRLFVDLMNWVGEKIKNLLFGWMKK
jgi:hypothetical protein